MIEPINFLLRVGPVGASKDELCQWTLERLRQILSELPVEYAGLVRLAVTFEPDQRAA